MDVFAIPVLAEMDSTVTARKPCSRRFAKAVSMITVSISSGRRRFTDLLSFSILFDIATPVPRGTQDAGSTARNCACYDTQRSFKNQVLICYRWEMQRSKGGTRELTFLYVELRRVNRGRLLSA